MKRIFLLLLAFTIIFTGCAKSVDTNTAQGIYEDKIVVGTTGAQQGPLAFIGKPYFDGMNAYFDMMNENGGIEGREIELIVLEDEFKPETAIANVQNLINDEKVFSLVGLFGTPGVKASIPTVQEAGIPAVYFATGATAPVTAGKNFFPVQPNYAYEGKLMSQYAVDYFKAKKIAVIYRSDDVGLDGLKGVKDGLEIMGKSDYLVAELSFDAGATDFTAQVAKVKESGADVLINYALGGGVSGVLKELEKMGMTDLPQITPYPNVSDSFVVANLEASPNAILNLYGMGWVDMTRPAVEDMVGAMAKYYPESAVNAYTVSGWIAAETFYKGLEISLENNSIDELNWENYITAMETLEYTEGIIPRIAYSPDERNGVTNMALVQVVGNTWELQTDYLEFKK
ncbi:ABC transporter substrate-binding protein [Clostridiaceae bacterium HSG29]|nr:ABC transporter substrate-binding protein [Clostridiaceae bacterium HSG29]